MLIPIDFENFSSNVKANILLYEKIYKRIINIDNIILIITSLLFNDNILPNKYPLISVLTPVIDIKKVPIAKELDEIKAIAESPCILLLSLSLSIKNDTIITIGSEK